MTYLDLTAEQQDLYAELDEMSKHAPLEVVDGVIRFKRNNAARWLVDNVNLNDFWQEFRKSHGIGKPWPLEDMMSVYRMMGYSLDGFLEVFCELWEDDPKRGDPKPKQMLYMGPAKRLKTSG